jgi:hypothetical protein
MRESVDREFAEYVDARQDRWFRGATLVCLDSARATAALRYTFTRLALRWGHERDPDAYALRILYERMIGPRLSRRATPAEPTDTVRGALGRLTPKQRALLVLTQYEDLTLVETGQLLDLSHQAVRDQSQAALQRYQEETGVRPQDFRPILEESVDGLLSPPLADDAWAAGAAIGRRRRRTAAAVAYVLLVALVVVLLLYDAV